MLQALTTSLATESSREIRPAPKSDSLTTILEQSLQGLDESLLEECLSVTDEQVKILRSSHVVDM
jgi:hypothetical protein